MACSVTAPIRPEEIRSQTAQLVLEERFAAAVAALAVGQYLWVVYHLHRVHGWQDNCTEALFTRRTACRPNPIGVTLTRIVELEGSVITVIGLDALNGSPILDIKPYKPIFDAPPVDPAERKP